jgi:hypothetical protein
MAANGPSGPTFDRVSSLGAVMAGLEGFPSNSIQNRLGTMVSKMLFADLMACQGFNLNELEILSSLQTVADIAGHMQGAFRANKERAAISGSLESDCREIQSAKKIYTSKRL